MTVSTVSCNNKCPLALATLARLLIQRHDLGTKVKVPLLSCVGTILPVPGYNAGTMQY